MRRALKRKGFVKSCVARKNLLPEPVARAIERSRVTPRTQTRGQLYEREPREDRATSGRSLQAFSRRADLL